LSKRHKLAIGLLVPAGIVGMVVAGIAVGGTKPSSEHLEIGPLVIEARKLDGFDVIDRTKIRFGKLTWKGGLVLTSPHPNFGGWSGIALDPDGRGLLAISDGGAWMQGRIAYDASGQPKGIEDARLGPLLDADGQPLAKKKKRDAEALTLASGTVENGKALVSFERKHRIVHYGVGKDGLSVAGAEVPLPEEATDLDSNAGIEAIAVMHGGPHAGSLVAIAEGSGGDHVGWIWIDRQPQRFTITNDGDFNVTDATSLADGTLLVLERRFRVSEGVRMRLRRIAPDALQPATLIDAEVLMAADNAREIDNMEAMAAYVAPSGETVVTLMSDDNFNHALQRTLLLQFSIAEEGVAASGPRPAKVAN
jgi:hypothetical protein